MFITYKIKGFVKELSAKIKVLSMIDLNKAYTNASSCLLSLAFLLSTFLSTNNDNLPIGVKTSLFSI